LGSGVNHAAISAIDTALWDVIGKKTELPVYALLALLRADADYFSTVSTIEQAAVMQGTSVEALKGGAMWTDSEEGQAWQKREKERLIEMYERVWQRKPPEFG